LPVNWLWLFRASQAEGEVGEQIQEMALAGSMVGR
jgi:hypothetical protein